MSVNKVILIGNVGKDPEVKYIKDDLPVATFPLATSESYKNKEGQKVENTEWHNIVLWRGLAKIVEQYVKKGDRLYIEGKIRTRSYDKDGQTRYFTEILGDNINLLGSPGKSDSGNNQQSSPAMDASVPEVNEGDDLPF